MPSECTTNRAPPHGQLLRLRGRSDGSRTVFAPCGHPLPALALLQSSRVSSSSRAGTSSVSAVNAAAAGRKCRCFTVVRLLNRGDGSSHQSPRIRNLITAYMAPDRTRYAPARQLSESAVVRTQEALYRKIATRILEQVRPSRNGLIPTPASKVPQAQLAPTPHGVRSSGYALHPSAAAAGASVNHSASAPGEGRDQHHALCGNARRSLSKSSICPLVGDHNLGSIRPVGR